MAGAKLLVREAGAEDLPAVVELLSRRDARENAPDDVRRVLFDLDPERMRAWIAFADEVPVGFNCLYLRQLRWGDGEKLAGYWAHLYVREEYRELMVYPQLLLAMMRGARAAGIEVMFTATRQVGIASANVKLGFAAIARPRVLVRPLRPLRLLARQWGLPRLAARLGTPVDTLYGKLAARLPDDPRVEIEELDPTSDEAGLVVDLLERCGDGRIHQVWTREYFRRRFAGTIDGCRYTLLVARSGGAPVAAVITRLADRSNGIRACVILDALTASDAALPAARLLLRHAHRRAFEANADLALCFDSLGTGFRELARPLGYRPVHEQYHFIVWPAAIATPGSFGSEEDHWRFAFADHDAF